MKKDDELRRKFAERFEDFEAEPQEESWEKIREAIQPKRKRRAIWLFFGRGCLALLIGAIGLFWSQKPSAGMASNPNPSPVTLERATSPQTPAQLQPPALETQMPETVQMPVKTRSQTLPSRSQVSSLSTPDAAPVNAVNSTLSSTTSKTEILDKKLSINALETNPVSSESPESIILEAAEIPQAPPPISTLALNSLPLLSIPFVPTTKEPTLRTLPTPTPTSPHPFKRKGAFTAGISLLSSYQIMQAQSYNGLSATDFSVLPALDARRLGTSLSLGYRKPIFRNSEVHAAISWMNLPYRAEYTVSDPHQLEIEILSGAQYRVSPKVLGQISEQKRLKYWGLQLDYGHTYRLFNQKIRVFAGGEGLWQTSSKQPEFWALAGLNVPLGLWRLELAPVFKYQFNRIEQADHLVKTRLYTIGLGIQTTF